MTQTYDALPKELPAPVDDGGARHLPGSRIPPLSLRSTNGAAIDIAALPGRTVVYAYPKTGVPGVALAEDWDAIPGARGCTPEACAFRDHFDELKAAGANHVFGLSVQDTAYQSELRERLHLPFHMLSDADLVLAKALKLPTFDAGGETLLKRITLIVRNGAIEHVFYPVFPPDAHAGQVLAWLRANP